MAGKNQIERILYIDKSIRKTGFVEKEHVITYFEVNARTIERDIEFLHDRLCAPIESSKLNNKTVYRYTERGFFLPDFFMTDKEILSMIIGEKIIEKYINTPFYKEIKSSYDKMLKNIPEFNLENFESVKNHLSIIDIGNAEINEELWTLIISAIHDCRIISINYRKPASDCKTRRIEPYHIVHHSGNWYLIGRDILEDHIKTYAVSRIQKIDVEKNKFKYPLNFNIDKHIDLSLGVYNAEKNYNFSIKFAKEVADFIKEKRWHINQKIEYLKNGEIILSFSSSQYEEVKNRVLSWGSNAELLQPEELKMEIKEIIKKMQEIYK